MGTIRSTNGQSTTIVTGTWAFQNLKVVEFSTSALIYVYVCMCVLLLLSLVGFDNVLNHIPTHVHPNKQTIYLKVFQTVLLKERQILLPFSWRVCIVQQCAMSIIFLSARVGKLGQVLPNFVDFFQRASGALETYLT